MLNFFLSFIWWKQSILLSQSYFDHDDRVYNWSRLLNIHLLQGVFFNNRSSGLSMIYQWGPYTCQYFAVLIHILRIILLWYNESQCFFFLIIISLDNLIYTFDSNWIMKFTIQFFAGYNSVLIYSWLFCITIYT